ncbi:MAG: hypothetical protein RID91_10815 [Azospirillaceae bacterium]
MADAETPPPRRPDRLRPPRWLVALSVAMGVVLFAQQMRFVLGAGPVGELQPAQAAGLLVLALAFNAGYVVAPFWVGRGPWRNFFAGILLAPCLVGWLLQFLPAVLSRPDIALIALPALASILGLYTYMFRQFWTEFQDSRKSGGPKG